MGMTTLEIQTEHFFKFLNILYVDLFQVGKKKKKVDIMAPLGIFFFFSMRS